MHSLKKTAPIVRQLLVRKTIFSLLSVVLLGFIFQFFIFPLPYFQSFAQCLDPVAPRADYLITAPTQGLQNRFYSRIGTCIVDPQAAIGEFRQTSYQQLFEEFYQRSKVTNKGLINGNATQANLNNMASGVILVKKTTANDGNLTLSGNPTGGPVTSLIFVEGDLYLTGNITYGNNATGLVFIVQGSVAFAPTVTRFDGVIIAQGTGSQPFGVCTAANFGTTPVSCPTSVDVGTNALVVNGSIVALDKRVYFNRKLTTNIQAAEQVNHQVKYLAILSDLLSRTTNIVSENTNYATCSAASNKPVGCACSVNTECSTNLCQNVSGSTTLKTCQPGSNNNTSVGTTPAPSTGATPSPEPTLAPVPPALVAHWTLDEPSGSVVRDVVGGNTGTTPGSSVVSGLYGLARDLANNSFITVNDSPAFRSQYTTVSMWVYAKDTTSANRRNAALFNRRNALNQYSIVLELDGTGGVRCLANGQEANSGSTKLDIRVWNHVVCSYDGNFIRLYVNKPPSTEITQVGERVTAGILGNPTNPAIQIGRSISAGHTFSGSLDDIRVYSYALTAGQVRALFNLAPDPQIPPLSCENPLKIFTEKNIFDFLAICTPST